MDQPEMKIVQNGSGAKPHVLMVRSGWSADPDAFRRYVDDRTDEFAAVWDEIVTQAIAAKGTGQPFDLEAEIAKAGIIVDSTPPMRGAAFGYISFDEYQFQEKQPWHKRMRQLALRLLPKRLRKSGRY